MKTLNEILDNYKDYEIFLDDRFGVRLSQFLTKEQLEKIGFKWDSEEPYPETIMVTKVITTKNTMKDCAIVNVIVDALEEYENNLSHKISILESRLHFMEKEREAIIRHLEEGNIDLLKEYFKIGK